MAPEQIESIILTALNSGVTDEIVSSLEGLRILVIPHALSLTKARGQSE